jgi:hypothetical protein
MVKRMPRAVLTTLSHDIDIDLLREAHRRTRKDGAIGVLAANRRALPM